MESLGWDIKSQTFFSNNYTWFRIIPPFWSFVNQNIIKFLVFFSWQISRLALNFRWWCGKSYFCPFDDFPDTISLLSSSLGKVLLNSLRLFFSDLSHHLIDSIYHLFHFHLISQKNLQFYHIWIGQYHFFLRDFNVPTNKYFNQTAPFITSNNSFFIFPIHLIFFQPIHHYYIVSHHSIKTKHHLWNFQWYFLCG